RLKTGGSLPLRGVADDAPDRAVAIVRPGRAVLPQIAELERRLCAVRVAHRDLQRLRDPDVGVGSLLADLLGDAFGERLLRTFPHAASKERGAEQGERHRLPADGPAGEGADHSDGILSTSPRIAEPLRPRASTPAGGARARVRATPPGSRPCRSDGRACARWRSPDRGPESGGSARDRRSGA